MNKAKVGPKIVQSLLRHSKIQTTLDLHTQGNSDEALSAKDTILPSQEQIITVLQHSFDQCIALANVPKRE